MSHSFTPVRVPAVHSMACKRYTVDEVVAELDESDFEDSEDDFDGYLDMESDNEAHTVREGTVLWRGEMKEEVI